MASHLRPWRNIRPVRTLAVLVGGALLACGCGTPGEPTARQIIVPQVVQDLQARQQGATIILSFTLPNQTTRKEPLAAPPAVEIYRGESAAGAGAKAAAKAPAKTIYTIPGEMTDTYRTGGKIVYRDAIGSAELARTASGTNTEWVYLVRTRAARNRASAESNRVTVRIRPAPDVVSDVSARSAGQSVTVTWPREASASYRVYRAEIAPESTTAAATDPAKAVLRMPLVQVAQTDASGNNGPTGRLQYQDENVEFGHAYLYIVRGVARFDADTIESTDSMPAIILVSAAVLPSAPQEVAAVVVEATANEPAYVSLSWAIESDPGVSGYVIYRSEQADGRGVRLNEMLSGSPTYRDGTAMTGRRYSYSVTAVDGGGRESAPSTPVQAEIPGTLP